MTDTHPYLHKRNIRGSPSRFSLAQRCLVDGTSTCAAQIAVPVGDRTLPSCVGGGKDDRAEELAGKQRRDFNGSALWVNSTYRVRQKRIMTCKELYTLLRGTISLFQSTSSVPNPPVLGLYGWIEIYINISRTSQVNMTKRTKYLVASVLGVCR